MEQQQLSSARNGNLTIDGLRVRFGDKEVLQRIDFSMQPGEFVTLLGRSGCGKSTMLRYIAGLLDAEVEGSLRVGNKNLGELPPHKRNTGFVFQNYALFPHMTVEQNTAFGLRARKTPKAEMPAKIAKALDLVQLTGYEHYYPKNLSGGMQQRVALARALVTEPEVLLLDEPLSALDANLRHDVRRELRLLHERLTELMIICVSHDREDALTLSHRIALMRAGGMEQVGTPGDLYDRPRTRYVAEFLGAVNFLPPAFVESIAPGFEGKHRAGDGNPAYCLRPEQINTEGRGDITFDAVCIESNWRGAATEVELKAPWHEELILRATLTRDVAQPAVGETVTCSFSSQRLHYVSD